MIGNIGNIHLKQSLKGLWIKTSLLFTGLFLFEMLFAVLSSSSTINAQFLKDMEKTPVVLEKTMGQGFFNAVLKYGVITFGYIHPFMMVLFILFIFISFSQVLTSEIYTGAVGFTLSKPVSRKRVYFNLALINYLGLGILAFSTFFSSFLGIQIFHGGKLSTTPFLSISWNLYLIMIFIAGYVAIFAAISESGKILYTYGGITLLFFYILSMAKTLWDPLKYISPISPFSYYEPMKMLIGGGIDSGTALIIFAVSIAMFVFAGWIFNRKDIACG
jgi:ABC-2 type transport system permease protein